MEETIEGIRRRILCETVPLIGICFWGRSLSPTYSTAISRMSSYSDHRICIERVQSQAVLIRIEHGHLG